MTGQTIAAAAVRALAVAGAQGQPHFEVAAFKLSPQPTGNSSMRSDPGRIDYKNVLLRDLPIAAYRVAWYRLPPDLNPTGPNSHFDHYDVSATLPVGASSGHSLNAV